MAGAAPERAADVDEVNLPGSSVLREAVATHEPKAASIARDGVAGLTVAVSQVPDAMAESALIGVNPIHGLYAAIIAPIVGGLLSRTGLMVVSTTSAAALVAAEALADVPVAERPASLFLMVSLAGVIMMVFGWLRLGRLTKFVSFSVMTGFLAGIAVLLVLSQLPTALGYVAEGGSVAQRGFEILRAPAKMDLESAGVAALTLALAWGLGRTRVATFGPLVGVAVGTAVALFVVDVTIVADIGDIQGTIPAPHLPSFSGFFGVLGGAFSVAAIVLVQGAGVAQSLPRDKLGGLSRDFVAQGAANVAAGLFRGIPVGASLGASALNVIAGATSRRAAIFAGAWMLAILLGLASLVAQVPMPALGALLILTGIRALHPADARAVWQAGWPARIAGVTTFLAMLFLPLIAAIGIGVALAAILHLVRSAGEVTLVELVEAQDGSVHERAAPKSLDEPRAVVLDAYGSLYFAGARTLERLLPAPGAAPRPVVILRLRGQRSIGSTLADVLGDYGDVLAAAGGRLYLTGVTEEARRQLVRSARFRMSGPTRVYPATVVLGRSTRRAVQHAEAWLLQPADR